MAPSLKETYLVEARSTGTAVKLRKLATIGQTLVAIICLSPLSMHAKPSDPMTFSLYWPCSGNASFCEPKILAEGVIDKDSARRLADFLANESAHAPHYLPPSPVIAFNSPGGDLVGALELGRYIRKQNFDTYLAPKYERVPRGPDGNDLLGQTEVFVKDASCASACAFAFVGGVNRWVAPEGRLGVHQFAGATEDAGEASSQVIVVVLAAYLQDMGVDRSLLDIASLVPPQTVHWLSRDDLHKLRVDNMKDVTSPWALRALPDGTILGVSSQELPGAQSRVSLSLMKSQGQSVLVVEFTPGRKYRGSAQDALECYQSEEPVTLKVDGFHAAAFDAVIWKIVSGSVVTILPLSDSLSARLRTGKNLHLDVSVPHACDVFDPSADFPLLGIGPILSAIVK